MSSVPRLHHPGSRRRFWDLIYDLADGGTTVLVTTHYMDEADYCEHLGVMLGGRLVSFSGRAARSRRRSGPGRTSPGGR